MHLDPTRCIFVRHIKDIQEPKNVKLLYDVLNYHPVDIKRAVLFVTNNVLVCDTPEDAMKVFWQNRYDTVALDGTFYHKSGIMSGGSFDLTRKAKKWDDKQIYQLELTKEKLTAELREDMKKSRKKSELNNVKSQIQGLETDLKYSKSDKEKTLKQIVALDEELQQLKDKIELIPPKCEYIEKSIVAQDQLIQKLKRKVNHIEDSIFKNFCCQIGMQNIRQYEQHELHSQQERTKKRLEFDNQKNCLKNQLEFELLKDTKNNVQQWERAVSDNEDELECAKLAQQKQIPDFDKLMRELEKLKSEQQTRKMDLDAFEEQIGKARQKVGVIAKDIEAARKLINNIENKLEMFKGERHSILIQSKINDIQIPTLHGHNSTQESLELELFMDSSEATNVYENESRIRIDYTKLDQLHKDLSGEEVKECGEQLAKSIRDVFLNLKGIQAPNMKASHKLEMVLKKLTKANEEYELALLQANKAKENFAIVKKKRRDKFMDCFQQMYREIDNIYKGLAQNQSAQASLGLENPEEPYLGGINYSCMVPGKQFQPMFNLSGGEQSVAALALLFTIHSYRPAPFFLLDEIDAALDNTNINNVAAYIRNATSLQTIIISNEEKFFSYADTLIGIVPSAGECTNSKFVTLDLSLYRADNPT